MADAICSADSASRLDPRPSLTSPARRLLRDMSARSQARVPTQG